MDQVLARHRKEQRDLQSQITQKKKSASKKTRKTVNDDCAALEQDLKARQQQELVAFDGTGYYDSAAEVGRLSEGETEPRDDLLDAILDGSSDTTTVQPKMQNLDISRQDADDEPSTRSANHQSRKPNRQKARLARRAAEQEAAAAQAAAEASNLPDLKAKERARMLEEFGKRGLQEKEVAANGHCMYSAVADQMRQLDLRLEDGEEQGAALDNGGKELVQKDDYKVVRRTAAEYISSNADDFVPFLEEPLEEYVHKIRDTAEWGGQLELLALANAYGIQINVLQGDGRVEKIESGSNTSAKDVWLAYYRHGFGLGEHYNSLRMIEPAISTA